MKRALVLALLAAVGSFGCGSKNPSGPSNQPTVFTVALKASNETPPVANAEANASGTAVITINTVKDSSGTVTSGSIDFNVTMTGFPNGSAATNAHIHNAPAGASGGVFVGVTGLSPGTAIQMPNGSGSFSFRGIEPGVDKINQILANPAGFYFNVHTTANPNGAIRVQLR
jgi:hypothetical protein